MLVGVVVPPEVRSEVDYSLDELARLVDTAGADPVRRVIQRRDRIDPSTFIGSGKAEELRAISEECDADTVVFDEELTPAQQYNLERILGRTAIDRTTVILDIFAQNAASVPGRVQVELAQLRHRLPRLRGSGYQLSQQAGGIGTRGPGETRLEVDRRRLLRRIARLESQLREIRRQRSVQTRSARRSGLARVAIVGYTNAGKSSLLNALCGADAHVEDRLFATLDALTRRFEPPGGEPTLLVDTVGFVNKLPHELVEAFSSTLEVVSEADLLLHVVDASAAEPETQLAAVRSVLERIGAGGLPEILVFNKSDASHSTERLLRAHPAAAAVSAKTGEGLDHLAALISDRIRASDRIVELFVPHSRGDVMAGLHRDGQVLSASAASEGMCYRVRLDEASEDRYGEFSRSFEALTEAGTAEAGLTEAGAAEAGLTEAGSTETGASEAGLTEAGASEPASAEAGAPLSPQRPRGRRPVRASQSA